MPSLGANGCLQDYTSRSFVWHLDHDQVCGCAGQITGLCCAVLCCAVLCCAVLCCTVLCCAVQCSAVQCSAMQCSATLCHPVQCHTAVLTRSLMLDLLTSFACRFPRTVLRKGNIKKQGKTGMYFECFAVGIIPPSRTLHAWACLDCCNTACVPPASCLL